MRNFCPNSVVAPALLCWQGRKSTQLINTHCPHRERALVEMCMGGPGHAMGAKIEGAVELCLCKARMQTTGYASVLKAALLSWLPALIPCLHMLSSCVPSQLHLQLHLVQLCRGLSVGLMYLGGPCLIACTRPDKTMMDVSWVAVLGRGILGMCKALELLGSGGRQGL